MLELHTLAIWMEVRVLTCMSLPLRIDWSMCVCVYACTRKAFSSSIEIRNVNSFKIHEPNWNLFFFHFLPYFFFLSKNAVKQIYKFVTDEYWIWKSTEFITASFDFSVFLYLKNSLHGKLLNRWFEWNKLLLATVKSLFLTSLRCDWMFFSLSLSHSDNLWNMIVFVKWNSNQSDWLFFLSFGFYSVVRKFVHSIVDSFVLCFRSFFLKMNLVFLPHTVSKNHSSPSFTRCFAESPALGTFEAFAFDHLKKSFHQ